VVYSAEPSPSAAAFRGIWSETDRPWDGWGREDPETKTGRFRRTLAYWIRTGDYKKVADSLLEAILPWPKPPQLSQLAGLGGGTEEPSWTPRFRNQTFAEVQPLILRMIEGGELDLDALLQYAMEESTGRTRQEPAPSQVNPMQPPIEPTVA
jgi:hypothetical protein